MFVSTGNYNPGKDNFRAIWQISICMNIGLLCQKQGPVLLQRSDAVAIFQPMVALLSKKATLPLAKILAIPSCRSSKTGPRYSGKGQVITYHRITDHLAFMSINTNHSQISLQTVLLTEEESSSLWLPSRFYAMQLIIWQAEYSQSNIFATIFQTPTQLITSQNAGWSGNDLA